MKKNKWMTSTALATALGAVAVCGQAQMQDNKTSETAPTVAVDQTDALSVIKQWPDASQKGAQALIDRYGLPDMVSDRLLTWNDKELWQKIVVERDPVDHAFPMPHQDFLSQTIRYKVPAEKASDLTSFDSSLSIDEAKGTLTSHCDSEKNNILALNIANDIVTGKRDVEAAKKFMTDTLTMSMAGKSSPYTEKLMFDVEKAPSATGVEQPGEPLQPSIPEKTEPAPEKKQSAPQVPEKKRK